MNVKDNNENSPFYLYDFNLSIYSFYIHYLAAIIYIYINLYIRIF